mmetsp:Transcript_6730/g.18844  ORF Transcript_6730/g.18844 Transcript_6730/m.18844 type:complete len:456 (-) Transcript_6730:1497-2864(-)
MLLVLHDIGLLDVLLMHLADADVEDGDVRLLEEGQQGLQGTERARLDVDAHGLLLEVGQDALETRVNLLLQGLEVVVGAADQELRARDGLLEARGADLHAHGGADRLVVHIIVLHPHLLHRLRGQETADLGDDGPGNARDDDLVVQTQGAVQQDHVDGRAEALDVLHLDHRALQLLDHLELVGHQRLREVQDRVQEVGDALPGQRARGDDRDVPLEVVVLPVEGHVQPPLVELQHDLVVALLELVLDKLLLLLERGAARRVILGVPLVEDVTLVQRDDEGAPALLQHLQRLHGLRLEAVHDVDDEDRHVAQRRASRAEVVEGLVARRVDDEQPGDLDLKVCIDLLCLLLQCDVGEEGGTDLLGDASGLVLLDVRPTNLVKELRLARVDVAHDADDRRAVAHERINAAVVVALLTLLLLLLIVVGVGLLPLVLFFGLLRLIGFFLPAIVVLLRRGS